MTISRWERVLRWRDSALALFPSMEGRWRRIAVVSLASAIAAGAAGLLLWNVGKTVFRPKTNPFPVGMADPPKRFQDGFERQKGKQPLPAGKPSPSGPPVKQAPGWSAPWGFEDRSRY